MNLPNYDISYHDFCCLRENFMFSNCGHEAYIFGPCDGLLLKVFRDKDQREMYGNMCDNKFSKIVKLCERKISYVPEIVSTISINGLLAGYSFVDERTFGPMDLFDLKRREVIHFLKETSNILKYFASQDITFGDVTPYNILIDPRSGKARFCDIDNIRIGDSNFDAMNLMLWEFHKYGGDIISNGDSYMHNLLTLSQLYFKKASQNFVMDSLLNGEYMPSFYQDVSRIQREMTRPAYFSGDYAIQYVKR